MTQDNGSACQPAIQRLRDAGLYVFPETNASIQYEIAGTHSERGWFSTDLMAKSIRSQTAVDYWSDEWPWLFRHWEFMPGPGPDDFDCEFPTVEQAVEAVLAFYFGQPRGIEGWICPLHAHPELSEDRVRAALGYAQVITEQQFEAIQAERGAAYMRELEESARPFKEWWRAVTALRADDLAGKDSLKVLEMICQMEQAGTLPPRPRPEPWSSYEAALRTQFLPIHHEADTSKTLCLRRDLLEGYIVSGR